MNARPLGRTAPMTHGQAEVRLSQARKFLEVAELVDSEADDVAASGTVAGALAVLAGIAAADAACGANLGLRSRGTDHRQALLVLAGVAGSEDASKALGRLLDLKDAAHYGVINQRA